MPPTVAVYTAVKKEREQEGEGGGGRGFGADQALHPSFFSQSIVYIRIFTRNLMRRRVKSRFLNNAGIFLPLIF